MALARSPSLADYCALVVLVVIVNAFYLSDARLRTRFSRARLVALAAGPSVLTVVLMIALARQRAIWWWLPALQVVPAAAVGILAAPITLVGRRRRWRGLDPGERRCAAGLLGLIAAAALIALVGTLVVTLASNDLRLGLATAVSAAMVVRWRVRLAIRRHGRTTGAPR